jgi:hypothetical protein
VPVVLSTWSNENEPIANTSEEALACFLRTKMHRLVMGEWVVERRTEGTNRDSEILNRESENSHLSS